MNIGTRLCGLSAATMLSAAAFSQTVNFSVNESGVFNQTTISGDTTLLDGLTVTSVDPPPPSTVLDSSALIATQLTPTSPVTGSFYLYGATTADFLEFQFTDGTVAPLGTSTWVSAQATLVASGGALNGYTSGTGDLAAFFTPTFASGFQTTGTSSVLFGASLTPTSAPEPASLAALGVGLVGLIARRRRNG